MDIHVIDDALVRASEQGYKVSIHYPRPMTAEGDVYPIEMSIANPDGVVVMGSRARSFAGVAEALDEYFGVFSI
jgi:hypothetical protein